MNQIKKNLTIVLSLVLALAAFSACGNEQVTAETETVPAQIQETTPAEENVSAGYYQIGDQIEDFTITTYDGREISLYKVLEEKDMVLLNLWATWCGPCGSEFPAMQEAYEQYRDKVEIIAVSVEPTDSNEILADYVQEKGMSFCVARDTVGLESRIRHDGIPTSVVVDRFGTVCLIEIGAIPDSSVFTNLFDIYTAEDYTKSLFMPSMFSEMPAVQPSDPVQLKEALNGGDSMEFLNPTNPYYWPMTVQQMDGRTVAAVSNAASAYSKSVLESQVNVNAGDVLVMEYKLESADNADSMSVEVDGKPVKKSSLSLDWGTYAYQFEESGSHNVCVSFETAWQDADNGDGLWIDSIRVVSGDEAAKALEANRKYPVGEKIQIMLLNENVKKAYIYDEAEPDVKELVYFCADPTLRLLITLDETVDPENAFLEDYSYNIYAVGSGVTEDGFVVELPNTDAQDMIAGGTLLCDGNAYAGINIFNSGEHADQYFDMLREMINVSFKWESWDESTDNLETSGDVTYTVTYVDQNGDPVPGVMCQVCDDSMCQVFVSDVMGVCRFTLPAKSYEIHTLMVPAGYEGDTTTVTEAPLQGGELIFTLTKK